MRDDDCVHFLQWAAPRLRLRWAGFRRVRGQVCKRITRRWRELGLASLDDYRGYLDAHADEWAVLAHACRVTISRFGRDRGVWDELARDVLPRLAAEARGVVSAWSAGCGAGEEPYTLAIAWSVVIGDAPPLAIVATDAHPGQLARAVQGCYPPGTLRELPEAWRAAGFEVRDGVPCVRERFRSSVRFAERDVRAAPPGQGFDLVLCRNLVFTYFDDASQVEVAHAMRGAMRDGAVLVVGVHEQLPAAVAGFTRSHRCCYVATARPGAPG